jgi:thiol-disulfide isomerase/thioredoxin
MMTRSHTRKPVRIGIGAALIVLVLGVFARAGWAGELSTVAAAPSPGLVLPDLGGRERRLDDFAGKVVLVSFWASWCRPCVEEMPTIRRLVEAMRDRPFAVVAVNVGESRRRVQAAARRLGIDFPVLLDKDSTVFEAWGATVLPTAYVLDRAGRVRYVGRGPLEWDRVDIVELLQDLADRTPSVD